MAIPLMFLAKATSIKLILCSLATSVLIAILFSSNHGFLYFRSNPIVKNQTSYGYVYGDTEVIVIPGAVGPESFAFDSDGGGPYTGVSDGRIIRWLGNESRWVDFAYTSPLRVRCEGSHDHSKMEHICGRPLGLRFNEKTGDLYIADAYMGLLKVGPNGGLATQIASQVDGLDFGFTNSLDIDQHGVIYFTDSSRRYPRRKHIAVILSGDNTGRLMKFDPKTKNITILVDNLKFPNGVALSKNGQFLLFTETTTCRLLKLWLETRKAGMLELVTEFPGFPDNIKRNSKGEFWVGINSRRGKFLEWFLASPWMGNALVKLPVDITKLHSYMTWGNGMGIRLDRDGNMMDVLDFRKGKRWKFVSEVEEENECLWIGSVRMPHVVKEKRSS